MLSYLKSDDFKNNPPQVLIWEFPERYLPVNNEIGDADPAVGCSSLNKPVRANKTWRSIQLNPRRPTGRKTEREVTHMTFTTTHRRLAKTLALAAGLSVVSLSALAGGDAALYGPSPRKAPALCGSTTPATSEVSATVGSTNLSDVAPLASSDFSFMPGGDYSAKVGSQTVPVKLAGDHYYTLVNNASGAAAVDRRATVQEQAEIPGARAEPQRQGPDPENRRRQDRRGAEAWPPRAVANVKSTR